MNCTLSRPEAALTRQKPSARDVLRPRNKHSQQVSWSTWLPPSFIDLVYFSHYFFCVPFGPYFFPHILYLPAAPYQERSARYAHSLTAHEQFFLLDTVSLDDFFITVA